MSVGLVVAGLSLSCASHSASRGQSRSSDSAAIRSLLEDHYFPGMDSLEFHAFAPAFHEDARLAFVAGGKLVQLDLAQWSQRLDSIRADPEHPLLSTRSEKTIEQIAVRGDVAQATVHFSFPDREYSDFLQHIRVADHWQIIAKVFQMEMTS